MPHGHHIYAKAYDTAKATMCDNSQYDNALPHWKCVFICCDQCPRINITDQETDDKNPNPSPSIHFHIYHLIARYTRHGRLPLNYKKSCRKCQQDTASVKPTKTYNRKELVMMETTISNFHTGFFISDIHKLEFQITHVQILGKITVVTLVELLLNAANNFKMCYVAVIMMMGSLIVLPTKYNHNIMVEVYMCLLRVLYWNISVH